MHAALGTVNPNAFASLMAPNPSQAAMRALANLREPPPPPPPEAKRADGATAPTRAHIHPKLGPPRAPGVRQARCGLCGACSGGVRSHLHDAFHLEAGGHRVTYLACGPCSRSLVDVATVVASSGPAAQRDLLVVRDADAPCRCRLRGLRDWEALAARNAPGARRLPGGAVLEPWRAAMWLIARAPDGRPALVDELRAAAAAYEQGLIRALALASTAALPGADRRVPARACRGLALDVEKLMTRCAARLAAAFARRGHSAPAHLRGLGAGAGFAALVARAAADREPASTPARRPRPPPPP